MGARKVCGEFMNLSEYKKLTGLAGTAALDAYKKGTDPQIYIDGRRPKKFYEHTIDDIAFLLNVPKSTLISMRKYGELPEPCRRMINENGKWVMLWNDEQIHGIKPRKREKNVPKRTISGMAAEFILFNSGRSYLL